MLSFLIRTIFRVYITMTVILFTAMPCNALWLYFISYTTFYFNLRYWLIFVFGYFPKSLLWMYPQRLPLLSWLFIKYPTNCIVLVTAHWSLLPSCFSFGWWSSKPVPQLSFCVFLSDSSRGLWLLLSWFALFSCIQLFEEWSRGGGQNQDNVQIAWHNLDSQWKLSWRRVY